MNVIKSTLMDFHTMSVLAQNLVLRYFSLFTLAPKHFPQKPFLWFLLWKNQFEKHIFWKKSEFHRKITKILFIHTMKRKKEPNKLRHNMSDKRAHLDVFVKEFFDCQNRYMYKRQKANSIDDQNVSKSKFTLLIHLFHLPKSNEHGFIFTGWPLVPKPI